ncbi:MAG: Asp-tRNA(Asn)/Glu-tRNA(Gln) amidotransferase subunit GatB [Oscillospiraceae bacterium]|jgi:aspartyl-tRNA(Asn)/glutamyl-tRNA(Gln) amidotransferase subunit B|nr:Asp-tRNA(Asn)/Glu-tRNA(Gln) amidotransferase subunit GatB [Oscillospiraceae bacterium]
MAWETVIGLEVHVELATKSKIFCSCTTQFGGEPNTHCCPICMGMPGTLPVFNEKVLEFALKAGIALNCEITKYNKFDRKNYYYPDLPKAYQISQLYFPFARNGHVDLRKTAGIDKTIRIHEIHMEEDAGKLIHSPYSEASYPDYNRCGVPLIEIVSEPDFRTAEEVIAYLEHLRGAFEYMGISDVKMEEGSMRADVNLSVRPVGQAEFGTRTEMKNMNSFKSIQRAIEFESRRQIEVLEAGGIISQETRRWDDNKGKSFAMRAKENAHDYRYFPEPDILPLSISDELIATLRAAQPELAFEKRARYVADFGLTDYDADLLTRQKKFTEIFEETAALCGDPKDVSVWILGELMRLLNDQGMHVNDLRIDAKNFADLILAVKNNTVNRNVAKKIFQELVASPDFSVAQYIADNKLSQVGDESVIREAVLSALSANPKTVEEFKGGKDKVVGFLVGQTMKVLAGRGNPGAVNKILIEELQKL